MSCCNTSGGKSCCGGGKKSDPVETARRWFLKSAATFTSLALAPGVTLMAFAGDSPMDDPGQERGGNPPVTSKHRWGMLIDQSKCNDGCSACVTACSKENGWGDTGHPETDAQWIRKVDIKNAKTGLSLSLPVMCQHCSEPPCVDVCPTGASFRRADGIVLVDKHICIGCRYCMMACPYKARSFVHEPLTDQKPYAPRGKGTVESCTLCVHRVDSGRQPACVEACAATGNGAMIFGDLNDPTSEIAKRLAEFPTYRIRADLGCDPGVYYRGGV
jgi:tetrathionate reductase subunit B